jgi:archaemetzincin
MISYRIFFVLVLSVLILSCENIPFERPNAGKTLTILLQPFDDVNPKDIAFISESLKKIYPRVRVAQSIPLPGNAWNLKRKRYRADSLISVLRNQTIESEITLGITNKDISTTKNSKADWGVMGLGFCPGNACVVSSFRLSPRYRQVQLLKVSVHELGHTQGLQHCKIETCLMRDAGGRNHINKEKGFCNECRSVLIKKGWNFDNFAINE